MVMFVVAQEGCLSCLHQLADSFSVRPWREICDGGYAGHVRLHVTHLRLYVFQVRLYVMHAVLYKHCYLVPRL